jgi:hypothetical protein
MKAKKVKKVKSVTTLKWEETFDLTVQRFNDLTNP